MGYDVISQEQEESIPTPEVLDSNDSNHIGITINKDLNKSEKAVEHEKVSSSQVEDFLFSDKMKRAGRFGILVFAIIFLIAGRFGVPDNEVLNVQDKVMDALTFANNFINTPGNENFRNFFQAFCSLMVDAVFIITFGYWVLKGTNGRLPVTLAIFYVTRALVQMVWFSPFPQGFYWESPGVPSLVVPYGRGSDFFFSGHSGFLVICASEWHRLKFPRVRNFVIFAALYTMLILLVYRIHYSIDIFTGVFFAEWCFGKVDAHKDIVDGYWIAGVSKIKNVLTMKPGQLLFYGTETSSINKVNEKNTV